MAGGPLPAGNPGLWGERAWRGKGWPEEMRKWAGVRQAEEGERGADDTEALECTVTEVENHEEGVTAQLLGMGPGLSQAGMAEFGPWVWSLVLS